MNLYLTERKPLYEGTKTLPAVNTLKLFMALMVVGIHLPFYGKSYVFDFLRIAVPIFFMISGYFLPNNKGQLSSKKILKAAKKIIMLIVVYNLVYLGWKFIRKGSISFSPLVAIVDGGGICEPLWYLTAYVWALACIYLFVKLKLDKLLFLLIPIGLAINLLMGTYSSLLFDVQPVFITASWLNRNFFTVALPCIAIGIAVRLYQNFLRSNKLTLILVLLFGIGLLCERYFILNQMPGNAIGDISIFTIPLSLTVFVLAITNPKPESTISQWGIRHSTNIYLLHILIYSILGTAMLALSLPEQYIGYCIFPATILFTILVSNIGQRLKIIILNQFNKFKALKSASKS